MDTVDQSSITLQVQFEKKVFVEAFEIYETFNSGALKRIEVMQPNNKWYTVWQTATAHLINKMRTFSPKFDVSVYVYGTHIPREDAGVKIENTSSVYVS